MPTDEELALIDLAAATYRYAGAREAAMADRFGLSPTRFWQKVHALRVRGDVVAARAGECARLTRLADARAAARRGAPYGAASPPMGTFGTRPFESEVG